MKEGLTYDKKSLRAVLGNNKDYDELAKDCVAFANSEGGHLAIGIENTEEIPDPGQIVPDGLKEEIVKRISDRTVNVVTNAKIVTASNGGQYVDLEVFKSTVSFAGTTKGGYFYRDNDESKPITPDELLRAVTDKPSFLWETEVTSKVTIKQCDQSKFSRLLQKLRDSDRVSEFVKSKTDNEILEYFSLTDENGFLTNLGILWIGTQPQRSRLLYTPTIQYLKYDTDGNKVFKKVWDDNSMNPEELLEDVWNNVPDWKESYEISEGLWRKEIPAYDKKVVREILCNAIAHRPYTTRGDIFINIYPNKMVVVNPGRLPFGVTPHNILQKSVKRNKELSRILFALHIMEGEGSGYDLMYETQLSLGKSVPALYEGEDYVTVSVDRKVLSKDASRFFDHIQYLYPQIANNQKAMIALGLILQEEIITSTDLSRKLQLPEDDRLRSYLEPLSSQKIILPRGKGKGTKYYVNPTIISDSKANIQTTLKTIEPYRLKELIRQDLKYHSNSLISEISQRLPDVPFKELQRMVRTMALEGELIPVGGRKYRRYRLP